MKGPSGLLRLSTCAHEANDNDCMWGRVSVILEVSAMTVRRYAGKSAPAIFNIMLLQSTASRAVARGSNSVLTELLRSDGSRGRWR